MANTVYMTIPESNNSQGNVIHFAYHDKKLFKKLNDKGYGIFFTVNFFEGKTRTITNLKQLRYLYIDVDFRKEGENISDAEVKKKREIFYFELMSFVPPTKIVTSKNGMHPLWRIKSDDVELYEAVIKQLILWSKDRGSCGDNLHDVARVLRLPGYNHMKGEPYMCELILDNSDIYDLEYISDKLTELGYKKKKKKVYTSNNKNDINADIREIMIDVCELIGVKVEFDKVERVLMNGRLTGIFQGRNDDRQYIVGEASHERTPSGALFQGNAVTLTANVLGISTKRAYKLLIDSYGK